jgi:hypothetical protein
MRAWPRADGSSERSKRGYGSLRGHANILKRQLIHVGSFNLSLTLRKLLGAGKPKEWNNCAKRFLRRLFLWR